MTAIYLFYPFLQPQFWPYWVTAAFALAVLVNSRRYPWLFAALGDYLLGQMIGKLALAGWDLNELFWLSTALAAALGLLALAAMRPLVALASFVGVGYLAYTLGEILGVGSPWNFIVYAVAGGIAAAALFMQPFDRALIVNSALVAAGAIIATLIAWIVYIDAWNGWSAVIMGAIAAVVGIIHQFRELATAKASAGEAPA